MIGIIAAMTEEMDLLIEEFNCDEHNKLCGITFFIGQYNNQEIVLAESGVGKVNAAMAASLLIDHFGCDFIINTGIAGGLKNVATKDIILVDKLYYSDVDATVFGYELGQIPGMPKYYQPEIESILLMKKIFNQLNLPFVKASVYTADIFVTSLDQIKLNLDDYAIAEMEGTAIAQVCTRSGVPFIVLRYVSDIVGKESQLSDYRSFESEMAKRSSKICLKVVQQFV